MQVTDNQIRDYDGLIRLHAYKYVGRAGAELDDLIQEGRVAVWSSLQDGQPPSSAYIEMALRLWVKKLRRQIGG